MFKKKHLIVLIALLLFSGRILAMDPYLGEIRIFAGNYTPPGWAFCNGQSVSIAENDALFALLGTTYGGDGQSTFALPDLRGRIPISIGQGAGLSYYTLGEMAGSESVTLTANQLPVHNHTVLYNKAKGDAVDPTGNYPARNAAGVNQYGSFVGSSANPYSVSPVGGSQPHENMQPYLGCNYIIALQGIFPSHSKVSSKYDGKMIKDGKVIDYIPSKDLYNYIGEISIFAFDFAPQNYAQCSGQLLPINQNQALFSLLGTTYGGNGSNNFALPDIRGRVPVNFGQGTGLSNWQLGQQTGEEYHALTINEMPMHRHNLYAYNGAGDQNLPTNNSLAVHGGGVPAYSTTNSLDTDFNMIGNGGGSQPHNNMKPYTALNFCIALTGIFPSQSKDKDNETGEKGMDPFLGEIAIFAFNFTPLNYLNCSGQLLPLAQNTALFSIVGTTYGGNGSTNFALPDLRGRVPIHTGYSQGPGLSSYDLGQTGGLEAVTLIQNQMMHNHPLLGSSLNESDVPTGKTFGKFALGYSANNPNVSLNTQVINSAGGNQPHNNIMPSIGLNFCIAKSGIFPPHGKNATPTEVIK